MTLQERANAYAAAFLQWPASWPRVVQEQGRDVLYGIWVIGNNYRNKTAFYGSYPPRFVDRVMALFPDAHPQTHQVLHAFSGSLPAGPYARCDLVQEAEIRANVYDLDPTTHGRYWLTIADPPSVRFRISRRR